MPAAECLPARVVNTLPPDLPHAPHPGCLITPAYRNIVDTTSVAIVAVNAEGLFIYANTAAEAMLGYSVLELCQKSIFEVAAAEPLWVAEEFAYLQSHHVWSGHVLLRRQTGDFVRVTANAFRSLQANKGPEYMALLHYAISLEGPAIARLPEHPAAAQLTARDVCLLHLIAEGLSDKEIASVLSTSVWTINKDVSEMLGRFGASSRTEACVSAFRIGIIA